MKLRLAGLALIAAAFTTPSLIKFTQNGTGATQRTLASKLGDVVSVKDFGAVGDGSTDDSAAIQNAITAGGGKAVYFPAPATSYKVTATLTVSTSNTRIVGDGPASKIFMAFTTTGPTGGKLFDVTASGVEFNGIAIDSTGSANTPTATINHYAIQFHGTSGTHLTDIVVRNCSFTNLPWADNFGNVVATHAVYASFVDRFTVRNNMFNAPSGAAVFMSGVTGFRVLDNNINDTGWYSIHANDVVSQGRIAGNRITGTTSGVRVWGGSINLMSNSTTGTACGTPGCATITNVEIDHNYISGVHSYTAAVHIESSSKIDFHNNELENLSLSLGSPFYVDGTPPDYVRVYVRPGTGTTNEGPNDHISINGNTMRANGIDNIAIYADAQDNGSGTLAYSDGLVVKDNHLISVDTSNYFAKGVIVHGQQGGWKNVDISHNIASGFPSSASPVTGFFGSTGLVAAPVKDVTFSYNTLNLVGGVASTTTHLGISLDAFTAGAKVTGNTVNGFWDGIRTLTNSSNVFIGTNTFTGSGAADYLIGPSPAMAFGVIPRYGTLFLTGRGSNLAATTVASLVPVGEYRVCATARTTTNGTGTTATMNIIWTDEGGVKTDAVGTWALNAVDVTGQINKCEYIHSAVSTNIQVSVTAGTYGSSAYAISSTVEKLN